MVAKTYEQRTENPKIGILLGNSRLNIYENLLQKVIIVHHNVRLRTC